MKTICVKTIFISDNLIEILTMLVTGHVISQMQNSSFPQFHFEDLH